ncbi:MAG: OmpW family outer membrane protein [Aquabacterium sp.]|uniref:OmpW/AlkL family protein n=1 Tax=Aquabacterium sp. TaxID=1872578 RepID=UPI002A35E4F4|nr:OmpW family outer membrane protein [Aquabacterium sp.]MDX9843246.1 OmpW family outer membrane protein [Aquabacterium sp.]
MNKTLRAVAIAALSVAALTPAMAQESPWQVRVRAVNLDPANKDQTTLGADLNVNAKLIPEVDISYFFTPNIAAELILTYPQKHNIKSGDTVIGSLRHLPPTLTVQYHFMPNDTAIRPYVGAGVNYTNFSSVNTVVPGVNLKRGSWGWALQAGMDIPLNKQWSINLDVKKVQIHADVTHNGVGVGTLKVDPLLIGVGLGYRF